MIYYHIGLPKTGTTSLQKVLFENEKIQDYVYLGLNNPNNNEFCHRFLKYLRGDINTVPLIEIPNKNKVIFSLENISNMWISERYSDRIRKKYKKDPRCVILSKLERFHKVNFGTEDFKIILGLREKNAWLKSIFLQNSIHFKKFYKNYREFERTHSAMLEYYFLEDQFIADKNLNILRFMLTDLNDFSKKTFGIEVMVKENMRSSMVKRREFRYKLFYRLPYLVWRILLKNKKFIIEKTYRKNFNI